MVKKAQRNTPTKSRPAAKRGLLDGQLAQSVRDSAQQIWLAGMGAFGKAQEEGGRFFEIYKFRSMLVGAEEQQADLKTQNEADGPLFKIKDDPRLTRTGRLIRRLSLDELPQIFNVLLGQMSLVGPRPPLPEEVAQYKPWHHQRLAVVGGMTGLWQVSGRSDLSFDELCLLDIYYIENWTLGMDVRILLQTIPHLLSGKGAY